MTERCACSCHSSTPSPGWCPPDWLPATQADLRLVYAAITSLEKAFSKEFKKLEHTVSVSTDKLDADIQVLIAGYQAVVAANVALQAALDAADATKAAAVADAIAAEDADAQNKIDAADAVVAAATAPSA